MENEVKLNRYYWTSDWEKGDPTENRFIYFRGSYFCEKECKNARIIISTASRYKLYINGKFIQTGPCKGDKSIWYYDELDASGDFLVGENTLAIEILRYSDDTSVGNNSIFRWHTPFLYFEGSCEYADGTVHSFTIDKNWKSYTDRGRHCIREDKDFAPLYIHEDVLVTGKLCGWKNSGYDDKGWSDIVELVAESVHDVPTVLSPRPIPFLYRTPKTFTDIMCVRKGDISADSWRDFIQGKSRIVIPSDSEHIVEIDAGEEMNGYLKILTMNGAEAEITILESESYVQKEKTGKNNVPVKKDRRDYVDGHLEGYEDIYTLPGKDSTECEIILESFWYRTFRFISLHIKTKDEPLILESFDYEETGYPLKVTEDHQELDETSKAIWDISLRTLKRCMEETYVDCPFYERLQYAMDSRTQILYTYAVSMDDRLARKCMDDFSRAMRYDGTINCSYPNCTQNVIPGFGIYYILMVHDHMKYFGDREFISRHHVPVMKILDFFDSHLNTEGIVAKIGGKNLPSCREEGETYWSFIDWTKEWDDTDGMPDAGLEGPVTMESLLYLMGLQAAKDIISFVCEGSKDIESLEQRANKLKAAIIKNCTGEKGMLQDGPGIHKYSQHCQVFGVLTGVISPEDGKKVLLRTLEEKDKYAQCSVAMQFYLFEALKKAGIYDKTKNCWIIWEKMLEQNLTTCAESESFPRSDCHAWGALALYAFRL